MGQTVTILYVEDNDGDVLLLEQALEERHFSAQLQVIQDYESALRFLTVKATARDAPPPDLILLDRSLPRGDGAQLMAFILSSPYLRGIPTYLFTPKERCANDVAGIAPDHCIRKPPSWDGMLDLVDQLITAIRERERPV